MSGKYTIGLDYGTNSVRALIVDVRNGREVGTAVWEYAHGTHGVILARDPNLARQHPADYLTGAARTIQQALKQAKVRPAQIIGIGVDTTGSTPLPVDAAGQPLAFDKRFARNPAALAWLWKDHTSVAEAAEITALARRIRPHYRPNAAGRTPVSGFSARSSIACALPRRCSRRHTRGSSAPTGSRRC